MEKFRIEQVHTYPANARAGFMAFWKTVNAILKSHSLPEMLYGEARDWWAQCEGWKE